LPNKKVQEETKKSRSNQRKKQRVIADKYCKNYAKRKIKCKQKQNEEEESDEIEIEINKYVICFHLFMFIFVQNLDFNNSSH